LRLSGHDSTGSSLDFGSPGGLDFSGVLAAAFVKTGEQFGGDIGAFVNRQSQRFSKNFLRSGCHTAILDPVMQPNKRLHPTAA
jgi:hypothetical protein